MQKILLSGVSLTNSLPYVLNTIYMIFKKNKQSIKWRMKQLSVLKWAERMLSLNVIMFFMLHLSLNVTHFECIQKSLISSYRYTKLYSLISKL